MPKCVVVDPDFDWQGEPAAASCLGHTIIYEMHVQGYTKLHPDGARAMRGTYEGLGNEGGASITSNRSA